MEDIYTAGYLHYVQRNSKHMFTTIFVSTSLSNYNQNRCGNATINKQWPSSFIYCFFVIKNVTIPYIRKERKCLSKKLCCISVVFLFACVCAQNKSFFSIAPHYIVFCYFYAKLYLAFYAIRNVKVFRVKLLFNFEFQSIALKSTKNA